MTLAAEVDDALMQKNDASKFLLYIISVDMQGGIILMAVCAVCEFFYSHFPDRLHIRCVIVEPLFVKLCFLIMTVVGHLSESPPPVSL